MSRHLLAALTALVLGTGQAAAQASPDSNARLAELQQWMGLAAQHAPGRVDDAVTMVRSWSRESLQNVRDDLAAIRLLLCERCVRPTQADKFKTEYVNVDGLPSWRTVYAFRHIGDLTAFVKRVEATLDVNDLLKRGALLHTDVALRAPPIMRFAPSATYLPLQRTVIALGDGGQTGVEETVDHMEMARRLLELVTADPRADLQSAPERDPMVRIWYRATMGALLDRRQLDTSHTLAALQLLPGEGTVLFLAAAQHEALASPRYQRSVATRTIGDTSVIQSEQDELRRAEELFRRALKSDPEYLEAHLRLGQVLGRLGRHEEALTELRLASASSDPLLSYYGQVLIGREHDALGHRVDARTAYESAAKLFPRAQAPLLALSEFEMRSGNQRAAREWLDRALASQTGTAAIDPWASYLQAAGRMGNAFLSSIGASLATGSVAR